MLHFSPYSFESLNKLIPRLHCNVLNLLCTRTGGLHNNRLDAKRELMYNDRIPWAPHLDSAPAPDVEPLWHGHGYWRSAQYPNLWWKSSQCALICDLLLALALLVQHVPDEGAWMAKCQDIKPKAVCLIYHVFRLVSFLLNWLKILIGGGLVGCTSAQLDKVPTINVSHLLIE